MSKTFYTLSDEGFIRIEGPDAKKFLQGQVTCNVEEVSANVSLLGARCNIQGRVISLFRLFQNNGDLILQLPASMLTLTLESLKKFALFSKVKLTDASEQFVGFGLHTDDTQLFNSISNGCITPTKAPHFHQGFLIKHAYETILPQIKNDYVMQTEKAWHVAQIQQGVAQIYPDTSEQFTPHDLNLPNLNAVSFNKGCYMGQEIVARMHFRGTLKQHLYQATLNSPTPPQRQDAVLHEEKKVGQVVDCAEKNKDEYVMLVLLRDDATAETLHIHHQPLIIASPKR